MSANLDEPIQLDGKLKRDTNSLGTGGTARELKGCTANTLRSSWTLYSLTRMTYQPQVPHTGMKRYTSHRPLHTFGIFKPLLKQENDLTAYP